MNNNSGFTIIELMVAIGILGIISAAAVPNMISWRNNMQFNSAVRMVKNSIGETRMDAIKANMPSRLDFTVGANSFDSVKWELVANAYAAPITHQLPPGVTFTNSTFSSDQLKFNSRGMANNGTITIQSGGGLCRRIAVAIGGSSRIEVCP